MDFQIRRKLQICAYLLKKILNEKFIFCAVRHNNEHFQASCDLTWCQKYCATINIAVTFL